MNRRLDWLRARIQFWGSLVTQWWGWVFLAWALFGNATTLRDNFLSDTWQHRLSVPEFIPLVSQWGWQLWFIGLLLITLVMVLEGTYRTWAAEHHRVTELTQEITQLTDFNVICELRGPSVCFGGKKSRTVFISHVNITNSSDKTASIIVKLHILRNDNVSVSGPPENILAEAFAWELPLQSKENNRLTFPLTILPGHTESGHFYFGPEQLSALDSRPDLQQYTLQFINLRTKEIVHSEPLKYITYSDYTKYLQKLPS